MKEEEIKLKEVVEARDTKGMLEARTMITSMDPEK